MTSPSAGIARVAVIGTGTIGAAWAAYFLARNLHVSAYDPAQGAEARLRRDVAGYWPELTEMRTAETAAPPTLHFTASAEAAVDGADYVQESGPERLDLKQAVFRELDAAAPAACILASSSSGLSVSQFQAECRHPERVVLAHPFSPAHLVPLVEVVGGASTSPDTVMRTLAFLRGIGKRPIALRREITGHVANRLQAALLREAFHLVEAGVASVADVDTAIAHGPGLRYALTGPFLNTHLVGGIGGMAAALRQFSGPLQSWWDDLGTPRLTPDLCGVVLEGMQQALSGQDAAQLAGQRDRRLVLLLKMLADSETAS